MFLYDLNVNSKVIFSSVFVFALLFLGAFEPHDSFSQHVALTSDTTEAKQIKLDKRGDVG
jgi:hypothetical protein